MSVIDIVKGIEPPSASVTSNRSSPNSLTQYLEGSRILLVLLDNIQKDPDNVKYRRIRLENRTIKEKLLVLQGIDKLLLSIGFVKTASEYSLPLNVPMNTVAEHSRVLKARRDAWHNVKTCGLSSATALTETPVTNVENKTNETKFVPVSKAYKQRISFPKVLKSSNRFINQLEMFSDSVMQYEDANLKQYGRSLIPIDDLTAKANAHLLEMQQANTKDPNPLYEDPCIRDLLLVELVNWFNTEFFEWVNNLPCRVCGSEESKLGSTRMEGEVKVEVGLCCGQETKFYRYNDVAQLLVSRKGRCGEYANCFTFLCRCLDYDARLVHAFFDHVWCEVYSENEGRWLHVDPSDNVVDSSLMYQHGWKRKIDYVLAFSCDDLQDVTWRYVNNHKETLFMRRHCSEDELVKAIIALRKKRQMHLSEARKKELSHRCMVELIELTLERQPTEDELKGRSSGSLSWRQSRGENQFNNIYVFTLSDAEMKKRQFNLRYCCATDVYERYILDNSQTSTVLETIKTWQNAQFSSINIFRKVEHDWKMVYLARQENAEFAEIVWKFDFKKSGLKIKTHKLRFDHKIYGSGQVDLLVLNAEGGSNLTGCSEFVIKAKLYGGQGDVAWQHTQLFRQSLNSKEAAFDLQIEFL